MATSRGGTHKRTFVIVSGHSTSKFSPRSWEKSHNAWSPQKGLLFLNSYSLTVGNGIFFSHGGDAWSLAAEQSERSQTGRVYSVFQEPG